MTYTGNSWSRSTQRMYTYNDIHSRTLIYVHSRVLERGRTIIGEGSILTVNKRFHPKWCVLVLFGRPCRVYSEFRVQHLKISSFFFSPLPPPAVKKQGKNYIACKAAIRFQWPSGLRRVSAASSLLGLRVRIPSGAWISVSCDCCVLSGRGLCDGPIPWPEESYLLSCVIMRDLETSRMKRLWPALGCCAKKRFKHCANYVEARNYADPDTSEPSDSHCWRIRYPGCYALSGGK